MVGLIDYIGGSEMSFSVFYLLAVFSAVWFVGTWFGVIVSFLSMASWIIGDYMAGVRYSHFFVLCWNAFIILFFYLVVVWLLATLRNMNRKLEEKVRHRTESLVAEIAERERLEKEILEISEREQRRIGYDLHDSLCQHLTGTALAGQVLAEKLIAKGQPEANDANHVVRLIEEGIVLARNIVMGLQPVEIEGDGLNSAFRTLSHNIRERFNVECDFVCNEPLIVREVALTTQLYRIAQEAVANAVKHGKPKRIVIELRSENDNVSLTVSDDGIGLPKGAENGKGMGLRIMKHRALMIGGSLEARNNPEGGTIIQCVFRTVPVENETKTKNISD